MTTISASEFKAKCLQILDRVKLSGERILVTKHGIVVAEVGPPSAHGETKGGPGFAKDSLQILGDIIEPLDDSWEALK